MSNERIGIQKGQNYLAFFILNTFGPKVSLPFDRCVSLQEQFGFFQR
jgi:hypothetical protein